MKNLSINKFKEQHEVVVMPKKMLRKISGGTIQTYEDGGISAEDDWETPVV